MEKVNQNMKTLKTVFLDDFNNFINEFQFLIFVCFVYILADLHGHNLAFHPFRPLISDNLSLDKFHILASVNPIHLHL